MSNTPQRPGTTGTSGVTGGERRRLDRAPGERYADRASGSGPAQAPVPARWGVVPIGIAVLVADLGAVLFFALGLLDLGIGLVVVAAFAGWVTALALVWRGRSSAVPQPGSRMAVAAFLGGWVVVAGMLIDWIYALLIGGVLGPLDYWAQRYGIVALIALVYSLVGHGGASGYLALLALSPLLPREVAITALLINLVVAGTSFVLYRLARHFSWTLAWPLLVGSVPWAYLGARLPDERGAIAAIETAHDAICGALSRMNHLASRGLADHVEPLAALFERFAAGYAAHAREERAFLRRVGARLDDAQRAEVTELVKGL
ncbi:MAG: hypothetical protein WCK58_00690 [Chloroflexota bacterium]